MSFSSLDLSCAVCDRRWVCWSIISLYRAFEVVVEGWDFKCMISMTHLAYELVFKIICFLHLSDSHHDSFHVRG